ncbi:MAG: hypothetical protein JJU37_10910 [Balneolaceae bacterium]|nr:hypothetical protein [Balneolaceae bacterium]
MKKLIKFLFVMGSLSLLLISCGERGPVGPEGPQGPAGPNILPVSFEFNADLLRSNGFEFFQDIPPQIDIIETDVMLAYVFEEYIPEDDLEVWRKMPVIDFNNRGTRLLDFDFTFLDMRIFLDANYSLGSLDEFEGLLIRAVHIPADYLSNLKMKEVKGAKTIRELETIIGSEIENIILK